MPIGGASVHVAMKEKCQVTASQTKSEKQKSFCKTQTRRRNKKKASDNSPYESDRESARRVVKTSSNWFPCKRTWRKVLFQRNSLSQKPSIALSNQWRMPGMCKRKKLQDLQALKGTSLPICMKSATNAMGVKADCKMSKIGGMYVYQHGGFLMDDTPPENS